MNYKKALVTFAFFGLACFYIPRAALAADWPDGQAIRLIVPASAGSAPDFASRKVAIFLAERLKQAVVVDNKPGASGNIAMQALAASRPDGYTFGYGNIATLAINPNLFSKLPYDVDQDFAPVIALTSIPNVLVIRAGLPIDSMQDFVAYAKAHTGQLSMASAGIGTTSHLCGELFKKTTGISYLHIPYQNAPQGVSELMGGNIDFMIENLSAVLGAIQSGKVRALAITSNLRSVVLPNVPTMGESGVPGLEVAAWGGFVVPSGVSRQIVKRLNRELNEFVTMPSTKNEFAQFSATLIGGTPEAFAKLISEESRRWCDIVRRNGIKPE
jgi:tripartite-type tricarboxylate transporter receptor subunit TctC